jgi:hypothetical protein
MRTKDEILRSAKTDINNSKASFPVSYWLRLRELEVLIDIRDILNGQLIDLEKTTRENIKIPK